MCQWWEHHAWKFIFYIQKPWPGPSQAWAKPWVVALAWPEVWASQSCLRPGQSWGFLAKSGWNTTTYAKLVKCRGLQRKSVQDFLDTLEALANSWRGSPLEQKWLAHDPCGQAVSVSWFIGFYGSNDCQPHFSLNKFTKWIKHHSKTENLTAFKMLIGIFVNLWHSLPPLFRRLYYF